MLTDQEIDIKLNKEGLPLHGTREQKIERLVRNGLHAAEVKPEMTKMERQVGESVVSQVPVTGFSAYTDPNENAQDIEFKEVKNAHTVYVDPDIRKPGRPKKGK